MPALLSCLTLIAALPRIFSALTLLDPDSDAYEYIESVAAIREHLVKGTFSPKDLAGFWFPMYQFVCGCLSVLFNHPFYVTKLFSALCGAGTCVLVFLLAERLTGRRLLSLAAFALVAFCPLHIVYSGYSMTDVPFAFAVLVSLYLTATDRSEAASIVGAAAGLIRIEAWVLIVVIPAIEYFRRRKLPARSSLILLAGPVACLYIYWAASGDALKYFHSRAAYIQDVLASHPELSAFSVGRVITDVERFLYSANPLIVISCFAAVYLGIRLYRSSSGGRINRESFIVLSACAFFFSFGLFLASAYITNSQPQVWVRYGLIFLVIGSPLSVWVVDRLNAVARFNLFALTAVAICLVLYAVQIVDSVRYGKTLSPQVSIAQRLHDEVAADPEALVCSDYPETRVLSNLPPNTFVTSSALPPLSSIDLAIAEFRRRGIRLLVVTNSKGEGSSDVLSQIEEGFGNDFRQVVSVGPDKEGLEFRLYRIN